MRHSAARTSHLGPALGAGPHSAVLDRARPSQNGKRKHDSLRPGPVWPGRGRPRGVTKIRLIPNRGRYIRCLFGQNKEFVICLLDLPIYRTEFVISNTCSVRPMRSLYPKFVIYGFVIARVYCTLFSRFFALMHWFLGRRSELTRTPKPLASRLGYESGIQGVVM